MPSSFCTVLIYRGLGLKARLQPASSGREEEIRMYWFEIDEESDIDSL